MASFEYSPDEEYVVFKREDYDLFVLHAFDPAYQGDALDDAFVIRLKDTFASPALYGYLSALRTAIQVAAMLGHEDDALALEQIADYVAVKAHEADMTLPSSKFPDH